MVATGDGPKQEGYELKYAEKSQLTEKVDQKNAESSGEIEVVAVEQLGGDIKESGLWSMIAKSYLGVCKIIL